MVLRSPVGNGTWSRERPVTQNSREDPQGTPEEAWSGDAGLPDEQPVGPPAPAAQLGHGTSSTWAWTLLQKEPPEWTGEFPFRAKQGEFPAGLFLFSPSGWTVTLGHRPSSGQSPPCITQPRLFTGCCFQRGPRSRPRSSPPSEWFSLARGPSEDSLSNTCSCMGVPWASIPGVLGEAALRSSRGVEKPGGPSRGSAGLPSNLPLVFEILESTECRPRRFC